MDAPMDTLVINVLSYKMQLRLSLSIGYGQNLFRLALKTISDSQ
jgi:hypothetical protein